jgi:hypothetical protein
MKFRNEVNITLDFLTKNQVFFSQYRDIKMQDIFDPEGFLKPPSVLVILEEMNAAIRSRGSGLC